MDTLADAASQLSSLASTSTSSSRLPSRSPLSINFLISQASGQRAASPFFSDSPHREEDEVDDGHPRGGQAEAEQDPAQEEDQDQDSSSSSSPATRQAAKRARDEEPLHAQHDGNDDEAAYLAPFKVPRLSSTEAASSRPSSGSSSPLRGLTDSTPRTEYGQQRPPEYVRSPAKSDPTSILSSLAAGAPFFSVVTDPSASSGSQAMVGAASPFLPAATGSLSWPSAGMAASGSAPAISLLSPQVLGHNPLLSLQLLAQLYSLQAATSAAAAPAPSSSSSSSVSPALASLLAQQQQQQQAASVSSSISPPATCNVQPSSSPSGLMALASLLRLPSTPSTPSPMVAYPALQQQQYLNTVLGHQVVSSIADTTATSAQPSSTRITARRDQRIPQQQAAPVYGSHQGLAYNRMAHLESILSRAEKQMQEEERSRVGHAKQEQADQLPGKRKRSTDEYGVVEHKRWIVSDNDRASSSGGSSDEGDETFAPSTRHKDTGCNPKEILYKRKQATPKQVVLLEQVFAIEPIPTSSVKARLSKVLNMSPKRVSVWFKNKRARQKKKGIPLPPSSNAKISAPVAAAQTLATIAPAPRGACPNSD